MLLPFSLERKIFNQCSFVVKTLGKNSKYIDEKVEISFWSGSCYVKLFDPNLPDKTSYHVYMAGEPLSITILFSEVHCFRKGAWIEYLNRLYLESEMVAKRKNIDRKIEEAKYFENIDDSQIFKGDSNA